MGNSFQIAAIVALGSFVRVLSGFGGGTIMVSMLTLFESFEQTVFFSSIIHWFNNLLVLFFFWRGMDFRLFLYFGVPGALASIGGAYILSKNGSGWLLPYLGVVLILYALYVFIKPTFKLKRTPFRVSFAGVISGFSKGLFGVGGGVRSMMLSAFDISKEAYLSTGAALSILIDTVRLIAYYAHGIRLEPHLFNDLIFFIPAACAGAYIAKFFVTRINEKHFRTLVMCFLLIMGLRLLFF